VIRNVEIVETCSLCGVLERTPLQVDPSWDDPLLLAARAAGGLPHRLILGCPGEFTTTLEETPAHHSVTVTSPDLRFEE
jgi:hypothetical protein